MNFIEELKWRGMLHNSTPDIEKHLTNIKQLIIRLCRIKFDKTIK